VSKARVAGLIPKLTLLSDNKDRDYMDSQVVKIMDKAFSEVLDCYEKHLEEERLKPKAMIEEIVEEEPEPIIKDEDDKL